MPRKKVAPAAPRVVLHRPENGKLYWVKLHGRNMNWEVAKYQDSIWYVVGDLSPWGAVSKFIPGPVPPEER